jgi:adenylate cyclase
VRVPRGWSVLEASRSFHLPHASMCGGRARCSTCRVRVTAGKDVCPATGRDEQATLRRIGASPDVRLACQLRPAGDISVVPLVRTERPIYRPTGPQRSAERDIVVMFCDFLNRDELARDQLPQDHLYLLTAYIDSLSNVICASNGTFSTIRLDGICALFDLEREPARAARLALQAAGAIERAISDLDDRLGREGNRKLNVAVSIHAARAVVSEIGSTDPPTLMAVGEAMEVANELRKAVAAHGKSFAISEAVTTAAGVEPAIGDRIILRLPASGAPLAASLSASVPIWPPSRSRLVERRTALQCLWSG